MTYKRYKMGDELPEQLPFKLLYVTRSEYDKGWHSTPHTHHFTEILYIVKGKGAFMIQNYEIPIQENDLVFINPHTEHTEKSSEEEPLEYIALGIEGLSFWGDEEETSVGMYTYQGQRSDILFYLNTLLTEIQNTNKSYELVCRNIIEILIVQLLRRHNFTIEKASTDNMSKNTALIKNYINQNFRDEISLDLLADIIHVNKYYMAHKFKEDTGMSPIEYLNHIRIKESKSHLESTDYTIAEIALINGFSSHSFFSQLFKRVTKMSPTSYRKQYKHKNSE